jgi:hypothetical protein
MCKRNRHLTKTLKKQGKQPLYYNMKQTLTILSATLIITLFSLTTKAQDAYEQPKSYLSFMGGISSPVGVFKSSDYYNNNAGFAKGGVVFGFDGAIYVYKNLAIGYNFTYQDQGELTQNDAQALANGYNADFNKNTTTVTTNGRYESVNFMLGPQYTFRHKSFFLDLRAAAGFLKSAATPSTSIEFDAYSGTADDITLKQLNSTALAFAYGASGSLRWSFSDAWDIGIKEGFINTNGIKIVNSNNDGTIGRFQTRQPVALLQTTFSITLRFL